MDDYLDSLDKLNYIEMSQKKITLLLTIFIRNVTASSLNYNGLKINIATAKSGIINF